MIGKVCTVWLLFLLLGAMIAVPFACYSQPTAPPAPAPVADPTLGVAFDVVSIKPSGPQSGLYGVHIPDNGDGLSMGHYTVDEMVRWAYHLGQRWGEPEHPNVPNWYMTDRYDVQAKVAPSDAAVWHRLDYEGQQLLFRKVLADRFKFACHFVDADEPVYDLVVAKGGLKMKEAKPDEVSPYHFHQPGDPSTAYSGPGMSIRYTPNGWTTVFQRLDMTSFAKSNVFAEALDRPVIDKTGVTGVYNFSLDFSYQPTTAVPPQAGAASEPTPGPDIFTALQQQLGLKLEPGRGAIRQLIVDHVERPSED